VVLHHFKSLAWQWSLSLSLSLCL